ncbi:MAG: NFACT family protein [Lachnospiraceae bacterium]|nr:NFACT family protein [Lachnospiraceae bacterium]
MAFDGITIRTLSHELKANLVDGYIRKIVQPEKEELLLAVKTPTGNRKIFFSANASLPLLYLTEDTKPALQNAPNFCMLLRKHIGGGRICEVEQITNERVVCFTIEHRDELGDRAKKYLYIEIMGRHSNIIFCDSEGTVLDAIKHVSFSTSSVREVLPGRPYFIPRQEGKLDPYAQTPDSLLERLSDSHGKLSLSLQNAYIGLSRITASEMAFRAGVDADAPTDSLTLREKEALSQSFFSLLSIADQGQERACIAFDPETNAPIEFAPFTLSMYQDKHLVSYDSVSEALSTYYGSKNLVTNIRQKSQDLRKLVSTILERNQKKFYIQQKQMENTKKMDRFKTYGTLLQIYPSEVPPQAKEVSLVDFETNEPVRIPLDPELSAIDNSKKYFEKYAKLKRTKEAVSTQLAETEKTISHLASIQNAIAIADSEADLRDIRRELYESGYTKKGSRKKERKPEKSKPLHFVTEDGFHIYVGKNNFQNDELTFKLATGGDWWFHAKQIPGSHVIVRTEGRPLPDELFVICARIAGFYSQGRESDKLEIDYVEKKHVKKPSGAVPGFVVYYTNYSMTVPPTFPEEVRPIE